VYIKGKNYNLAKSLEMKNIRSFKRELLQEIGEPEKIDCKGDSVRITCYTELQKQRLLATTHIDNKEVTVSLPWSLSKQKTSAAEPLNRTWQKGVIRGISLDITTDDVKAETNAIWAHRVSRREDGKIIPTTAVIIAYEHNLPTSVNIGFMRHNVSVYIPLPIRCGNCQKYGHRTDQCKRDKPRCPRCTEAHDYSACTVPDEQIKCSNCGENHSSAYRGCKKYREISAALRKAATENITYRDAVKKLKDSTAN